MYYESHNNLSSKYYEGRDGEATPPHTWQEDVGAFAVHNGMAPENKQFIPHPKADISCGILEPEGSHGGAGSMVTEWPGGWQIRWKRQQYGVLRFNCADSLDRTNVASYFSAVMSLVEQTKSVGVSIAGRVYPGNRRAQQQPGLGERTSSSSGSLASFSKVGSKRPHSSQQPFGRVTHNLHHR
eukprot:scaffold22234_cov27-Prasinocladus_malaysianus.AAC.1